MSTPAHNDYDRAAPHLRGLLRHFADLRDGTHGDGAVSRAAKEQLFSAAVDYLDPYARQALAEINATLLLGSGTISASGVSRSAAGQPPATARRSGPWSGRSRSRPASRPSPWRPSTGMASTTRTCAAPRWGSGR
jgi:hypothetical protein